MLLHETTDHSMNGDALTTDDGYYTTFNGHRDPKMTTKGWKLLCSWKDGSSSWVSLKDMKESYPITVAEYAKHNQLVKEPTFVWWVPQTLRRRDRNIKKIKTGYRRKTHIYGIEVPNTVEEASGSTSYLEQIIGRKP